MALWKEKIFDLPIREKKITPELANEMGRWRHSGFRVGLIVFLSKGDAMGMQRIIEYMARSPFSLSRVKQLTDKGKVIYRTGKSAALAFPILSNEKLTAGIKRNFEMFEPLDFLAEVTQHIPNRAGPEKKRWQDSGRKRPAG